ncbi:hypothetical protein V5799_006501 [Amblyomma americanum]|uniref:Peptidase M13 N-terminal domain-containing protein n=1 Tax=Amblyomma americanum TaxID=6943 RepID=A0AAQ4DW79_AMBAM
MEQKKRAMDERNTPSRLPPVPNQGDAAQPRPPPSQWEYQPPSEYSLSTEERLAIDRPPEPEPAEEFSEGQWLKLDSAELLRRRREAATERPPATYQAPSWPHEQTSTLEYLNSSKSSNTEDKTSTRSAAVDPSPPEKRCSVPTIPPPPTEHRSSLQSLGVADQRPPGTLQHGTEDTHLPYWSFAKLGLLLDEGAPELQQDRVPAVLRIYDTETTTRDGSSSGASGTAVCDTAGEATTITKETAGDQSVDEGAESDDGRPGTVVARRLPWRKPSAECLQAKPDYKQPILVASSATERLSTKPPAEAAQQKAALTNPPEAKLPAKEPSAATPLEAKLTASRSPLAEEPATVTTAARTADAFNAAQAVTEAVTGPPRITTELAGMNALPTNSQPLDKAQSREQCGPAFPVRLKRAQPRPKEQPGESAIARDKEHAVTKNEGQPHALNINEPEWHHHVAAMLQRVPMRLLLLDLALAFLFVIFSHMRLLSLQGYTTLTDATSESPTFTYQRPVCRGPACGSAGLNLFYTLNHSADACRSIFDMVCRPWVREPPSKYHKILVGSERLVTADILREISKFLESQLKQVWPSTSQGKLALLYASCRDHEGRDRAGLAYFRGLLRRYQIDRWPFVEGYSALGRPQRALELFTRDTGAEPYFSLRLRKSGGALALTVGCPLLGLPPLSFIEKTEDVGRYADYIGVVLKELSGSLQNRSDVPASVVDFETSLARLHVAACKENARYERKMLKDLAGAEWNWGRFLEEVTQGVAKTDYLQSASWEYISNVTGAIVGDSVQAANYFGWKVVSRLAPYTTTAMANAYKQFLEATGLETHQPSRHCLTQVNRVLPFAMSRVYALKSPETSTNYEAYRVAYHVARSLDIYIIKDRQRLPPEVDSVYRRLRSTMEMTMGYPDWAADEARVDAYYDPVRIGNSYLESHMSAATLTYHRSFEPAQSMWGRERLMFPEDPERWKLDPAWRSIYDLQDNRFYILPANLQPPYYVEGTAPSLNYGGLGFLLATAVLTELFSHRVEQATASAGSKFLERTLRLLRARLVEPAARPGDPDGCKTSAAATRIAYLSYHMHGDFSDDQAVEGIEALAPDQLFFVGVARTLCTLVRSSHYARVVGKRVLVDALSAIDGVLLPLPEYRDAFNCTGLY